MAEISFTELCKEVLSVKNDAQNIAKEIETSLAKNKEVNAEFLESTLKMSAAIKQASELTNNAKSYADLAQAKEQAVESAEANVRDMLTATNLAKGKAIEAQIKSDVYLKEIIELNSSFKSQANIANVSLTQTANKITAALSETTDYHLGRLEFKRRQVDQKIDEANEIIIELKNGTLTDELKELIRENLWERVILECGIMDAVFAKAELMFINEECEQVKAQTELIAQEIELDRLAVQRLKEAAKLSAKQAQDIVNSL